jgi:hypothetical protein
MLRRALRELVENMPNGIFSAPMAYLDDVEFARRAHWMTRNSIFSKFAGTRSSRQGARPASLHLWTAIKTAVL